MDEQNLPCIVLQYKPDVVNYEIVAIDITTTYNYWEKEAFVIMHKDTLFPCIINGIEYKNFESWSFGTQMIILTDKLNKKLKPVSRNISENFYPGW